MNLKQFLKPELIKILLFIFLSVFFLSFKRRIIAGELFFSGKGVPLLIETNLPVEGRMQLVSWKNSNLKLLLFLILDLIFWYLISCLIIWIYDKFKKKAQ